MIRLNVVATKSRDSSQLDRLNACFRERRSSGCVARSATRTVGPSWAPLRADTAEVRRRGLDTANSRDLVRGPLNPEPTTDAAVRTDRLAEQLPRMSLRSACLAGRSMVKEQTGSGRQWPGSETRANAITVPFAQRVLAIARYAHAFSGILKQLTCSDDSMTVHGKFISCRAT